MSCAGHGQLRNSLRDLEDLGEDKWLGVVVDAGKVVRQTERRHSFRSQDRATALCLAFAQLHDWKDMASRRLLTLRNAGGL